MGVFQTKRRFVTWTTCRAAELDGRRDPSCKFVGMTRSFSDQVTRLNAMDPLSRN
jgi:hypothetical protein